MGFKKENNDLLKKAFSKALEQELKEIPNVGDDHEFSPHFSYHMEKVIEKSKTVKFKLTSPKAQRYIAAGIAAVFIVSTFTVAAKIAPPKTNKYGQTANTESIDKDNLSSKDKQNPNSSANGNSSNSEKHHSSKPSKDNASSQIDAVEPWIEESDETASTIYAEGYVASYESVFLSEADSSYVFHSNDRLYHRWNDLTLCGLDDKATSLSIELSDCKLDYIAIPLSDYPYSDTIINLKGKTLEIEANGLENAALYLPSYRDDIQYLIIETETESYLAKYLKCDSNVSFEKILKQVYDVKSADSFIHTAILNIKGKAGTKHTLTKKEREALYLNLSYATLTNNNSDMGEIIKKLIITTKQGGTINLFYRSNGVITLVNEKLGNHITLLPKHKDIFDDLLGLSGEGDTSSELNSSATSSEVDTSSEFNSSATSSEVESSSSAGSDKSSSASSKNANSSGFSAEASSSAVANSSNLSADD